MSPVRKQTLTLVFALSLLGGGVRVAAGSQGAVQLSFACATQTGCLPGDSPGFPITIDGPGSYRLTGDIDAAISPDEAGPGVAIFVRSSGVSIDLGGFTLRNICLDQGCSAHDVANTIGVAYLEDALRISNGRIQGFGSSVQSRTPTAGVIVGRNLRFAQAQVPSGLDTGGPGFEAGVLCTSCRLRVVHGALLLHEVQIEHAGAAGNWEGQHGVVLDGVRFKAPVEGSFRATFFVAAAGALSDVSMESWDIKSPACSVIANTRVVNGGVISSHGVVVDSFVSESPTHGITSATSVLLRRTGVSKSDDDGINLTGDSIAAFDVTTSDNTDSGLLADSDAIVLVRGVASHNNAKLGIAGHHGQVIDSTCQGNTFGGIIVSGAARIMGNTVTETEVGMLLADDGAQGENTISGTDTNLAGGQILAPSLCGNDLVCP